MSSFVELCCVVATRLLNRLASLSLHLVGSPPPPVSFGTKKNLKCNQLLKLIINNKNEPYAVLSTRLDKILWPGSMNSMLTVGARLRVSCVVLSLTN